MNKWKNNKENLSRILMAVVGIGLVLVGIFADEIGVGEGPKNFGPSQWLMLGVGIGMIIIGAVSSKFSLIVMVNLFILIPALLLVDNILYFSSPWLPHSVVKNLTREARDKYRLNHWEDEDMPHVVRGDGASYYRPLSITKKKDGRYYFDEFGYRNPPGYITQFNPDVILLGDSYTEGYTKRTMAEYLRTYLAPWKVYSLGIAGQGPQHWSIQFSRYINSRFFRSTPKIIVINFFSGNDVSDVFTCEPGKDNTSDASIKPDPPKRKFSLFGEIFSVLRSGLYLKRTASYWLTEPLFEEASDPVVVEAISESIKKIQTAAPSAVILLANFPTSDAIYGPDMDRCVKAFESLRVKGGYAGGCKVAAHRQIENSEFLRKLADSLDVEYFDVTPALRAASKKSLLHGENLHFNDEGNRVYSEEVTKILKKMKPEMF